MELMHSGYGSSANKNMLTFERKRGGGLGVRFGSLVNNGYTLYVGESEHSDGRDGVVSKQLTDIDKGCERHHSTS